MHAEPVGCRAWQCVLLQAYRAELHLVESAAQTIIILVDLKPLDGNMPAYCMHTNSAGAWPVDPGHTPYASGISHTGRWCAP